MGMALFESSGTFKPSDYGLSPGDLIHITAVGGGGGGAGSVDGNNGRAGSASSFGRYVTAAGGNPGRYSVSSIVDSAPIAQAGANSGLPAMWGPPGYHASGSTSTTGSSSLIAGFGANGWLPNGTPPQLNGFDIVREILGAIVSTGYTTGGVSSVFPFFGIIVPYYARYDGNSTTISTDSLKEYAARTDRRGGTGGGVCMRDAVAGILVSGAGGIGYGAGGGGSAYVDRSGYYGGGGNSGCIVHKDIVITSTDAIAVTVGNGGAGNSSTPNYCGGGGAHGCVAVFW